MCKIILIFIVIYSCSSYTLFFRSRYFFLHVAFLPSTRRPKNNRPSPNSMLERSFFLQIDDSFPLEMLGFYHLNFMNSCIFTENPVSRYVKQSWPMKRCPAICRQANKDPETGCVELSTDKGCSSFCLVVSYSEKRREKRRNSMPEKTAPLTV